MIDAYIGYIDKDGNYETTSYGYLPARKSPMFPLGRDFLWMVIDRVRSEKYKGRQLDWGAYVAELNKQQIIEMVNEVKEKYKEYLEEYKTQSFDEVDAFIESLDNDKIYAFTVMEL